MEIGKKLKKARIACGLTQEQVADKINVSRQTISNWENEKSYPDIIDRIDKLMEHLETNTNVVKSNQKLVMAILLNILFVLLLGICNVFLSGNLYYLIGVFCFAILSSAILLYQIIKKL